VVKADPVSITALAEMRNRSMLSSLNFIHVHVPLWECTVLKLEKEVVECWKRGAVGKGNGEGCPPPQPTRRSGGAS